MKFGLECKLRFCSSILIFRVFQFIQLIAYELCMRCGILKIKKNEEANVQRPQIGLKGMGIWRTLYDTKYVSAFCQKKKKLDGNKL